LRVFCQDEPVGQLKELAVKKLSRDDRRAQLLDEALTVVRDEGADALTLGHLAERAGVSKPIAYDHFGSRSGLLIALYKQFDDQQVAVFRAAIDRAPRSLEDVACAAGAAHLDCCITAGPEWQSIAGALKGDEEMVRFQEELVDRYVALYCDTLRPYTSLSERELRLRCAGIIGAADAIGREVVRKRFDREEATASLAALIVDWLG
jgi:AcrR family transcriptional regulator